MKLIIRLVILVVVALFLFTGGFWLGNQWKGDPAGFPDGESLAKLAGGEETSPLPEESKEPPKKTQTSEEIPENSPKHPTEKASPTKAPDKQAEPLETKIDAPPQTDNAKENVKTSETTPPEKPAQPTPKTEAVETKEKADSPLTDNQPPPEKETQAPPGETPEPKQKENQESLALIVTPEDLGKNQITYSVQAGTFLDKDLARTRLEQLKAKQYPAFMISAWDDQKQLWYTVRVGRYTDILKAQMAAKEITIKERIPATVYGLGSLRYEDLQEPSEMEPGNTVKELNKPETATSPPAKEDSTL